MKKYEINTLLKLKKECPKISTDLLDLQRVIITNIENPELKNNIKNIKELLINERKNLINKYDELEKLQNKCKHEIRLTSITLAFYVVKKYQVKTLFPGVKV